MALFTVKYAPQHSSQIVGQQLAITQLKDFILHYKKQKHKAALLHGPIGTGKTSSVYAIAKELNYDILEINSSDVRDDESISSFLSAALGQQSLFFTPKIILIDEVDNSSGTDDRGFIPALVKALEKSPFPVILTANDPYEKKLKPAVKLSLMIEYPALLHKTIAEHLYSVAKKENIAAEEKAINSLARQVDGDLRAALLDLQICSLDKKFSYDKIHSLSDRKRTESILQALAVIFKSSSVDNALPALDDVDVEMNEIFLWMDENLPKEYQTALALARAYEHLSRADVFQGRIRKQQHWRFLVYISNLLTAGISSAKDVKNTQFIPYKPTMRLLRIWQANQKNARRKAIAQKLAAATHTSAKAAVEQIMYLKPALPSLAAELELTEEEREWASNGV
ncbi:replication factor C large subunit [Candidatus Woesearchaeota archaeon]|nr:replication factor C large subunit [Candidatus Woesearchaeota archaeon]